MTGPVSTWGKYPGVRGSAPASVPVHAAGTDARRKNHADPTPATRSSGGLHE